MLNFHSICPLWCLPAKGSAWRKPARTFFCLGFFFALSLFPSFFSSFLFHPLPTHPPLRLFHLHFISLITLLRLQPILCQALTSACWFPSRFVHALATLKNHPLVSLSTCQRKPLKTESVENLSMYSSCVRDLDHHLPLKLQSFRFTSKPCSIHSKSCG
ncbi:hypothetical protein BO78DRAFT_153290 [Aspergillus sclerotiicarbonarius CBS 121057]|uniref:Uncharacterized protein n=1 Tax=Aspergillus sclerotiicarbonarius (strain CBS 121057 / IBT 28362) TaxID=1448318 RepID=A0A319EEX5_ASPSB|nr:hypothetical protein BO78DRAFT_153290 [Aspergillus sclerotiicarbonarius CBS 121057]